MCKTYLQLIIQIPLFLTNGAHIWNNNCLWCVDYDGCSRSLHCHMYVCRMRVPPLTYRRTPSSHKDTKGSFTTRPTDKVPGYKKCDKKGLLFKATSMLAQYQQGSPGLFRWWEKPESLEKNHRKLVRNRQTV